jgi:hypothetical protein
VIVANSALPDCDLFDTETGQNGGMKTMAIVALLGGLVAHEGGVVAKPTDALPSGGSTERPVIVALVVDQMASWVLRERLEALPPDGGFARLRREGMWFHEMAFEHAITETAPGHASLFTGKVPRVHGVIANDVPGPEGKKHATIADASDAAKLVDLDGKPVTGMGASLENLEAKDDLVATAFRNRYPAGQGLVAALSLKDRGTLFAAGEDADLAIWFDAKQSGDGKVERGAFVTTVHYAQGLKGPAKLGEFVRSYLATGKDGRDGVARLEDQVWKPLDFAWVSAKANVPGDSDYVGFVGAHMAGLAPKPGAAFRALPASDRFLLEMAVHILKTESQGRPTFLSVSLSANDYIGHLFGPDSWEAWDELRRLDASLAWFFAELDRLAPHAWSVVLSADHGTPVLGDESKHPRCANSWKTAIDSGKPCSGTRGDRVYVDEVKRTAEAAAGKAGLKGKDGHAISSTVSSVVYPYIYLTPEARAVVSEDPGARQRLTRILDTEMRMAHKAVQSILNVAGYRTAKSCPDLGKDPMAALVCNSVSPRQDRGGDFYMVLKPGAFFDADLVKGTGISHGSPYGYDRFVPVFVLDPRTPTSAGRIEKGRVPFSRFHDELVRMMTGAP